MKAKSGKNWLPDKDNKAVPITDRRDLEDVICLEVEGGPETKCESVEWHISNMIAVFAPLSWIEPFTSRDLPGNTSKRSLRSMRRS